MREHEMTLKPRTVVRYTPDPSRHSPHWCREGMAIVREDGKVVDTYWQSGGDAHVLDAAEMESAEEIFDLADYRELERHERYTWETYHPDDRQVITSQHGLQRRFSVRLGAEPDLETQIEDAREKVAKAEDEVRSAAVSLRIEAAALGRLEAKR